jgi:hypothetical protein
MDLRTDRMKLTEVFPDLAKTWAKKLHIKADTIDYVRKGIPIDPSDITIEAGERAAIRYVSTPRLDRDGEILLPDGAVLDTFRDAPVVLYAHDYSGLPIGRDAWIKVTKKGLLAKTIYANHQLAQDVYDCVKDGFLTSSSVGFIPVESVGMGDKDFQSITKRVSEEYGVPFDEVTKARRIYTKWVLLEHSDVPVPSNAQSLNVIVGKDISARLKKDMGVVEPEAEPAVEPVVEIDTKSEPVEINSPTVSSTELIVTDIPADEPESKAEVKYTVTDGPLKTRMKHAADLGVSFSAYETAWLRGYKDGREDVYAETQESKAEGQPIDDKPVSLDGEYKSLITGMANMLLSVAAKVDKIGSSLSPVAPDITERSCTWADLRSAVTELTARIESIKVSPVASVSAIAETAPVIETPAPIPEPVKSMTADELKAAVLATVKGLDIAALVRNETTLALSKLKGKVTG